MQTHLLPFGQEELQGLDFGLVIVLPPEPDLLRDLRLGMPHS